MTLPKTFFTLIGSEHDVRYLDTAVAFARANDAHLTVAVIGVAPPPPLDIYNVAPLDWWTQERAEGMTKVRQTADAVRQKLEAAGLPFELDPHYIDETAIAGLAGRHARYADVSVSMAPALRDGMIWRHSAAALLFESARPLLYTGEPEQPVADPERIVVAWDSGREAARAVYCGLDMLKRASEVHVTMVAPQAREAEQGEEPGADIGAYLARHGIRVRVDRLPAEGRSIGDVLLRHARDVDAKLIISGAYGHSRLRQFVFGGTTTDLMQKADRAILFAH